MKNSHKISPSLLDLRKKYQKDGRAAVWRARWNEKNKKKFYAQRHASNQLRLGNIKIGKCEKLNAECSGKLEMHHEDYDKPLDITWYCQFHHGIRHREINNVNENQTQEILKIDEDVPCSSCQGIYPLHEMDWKEGSRVVICNNCYRIAHYVNRYSLNRIQVKIPILRDTR